MKKRMNLETFTSNELSTIAEIVSFNNNIEISIYSDSTVVKSPESVFRGTILSRNRLLSEEYLLNFQHSESDFARPLGIANYGLPMVLGAVTSRHLKPDAAGRQKLPKYKLLNMPLGAVIRARRSRRKYSGASITMQQLSTILYHSQGITGKHTIEGIPVTETLGSNAKLDLRAAPSGGGLHPIDVYCICQLVEGLRPGIYKYDPAEHALEPVQSGIEAFTLCDAATFGELQADKASFGLVYVYNLFKNSRKYGDAGLAFAMVEVGQISENVHLACTALGLGSCDAGGFRKQRLEEALRLDGVTAHVTMLTVIGG